MRHSAIILGLAALGVLTLAGCGSDRSPGASSTEFGYSVECPKVEGDRAPLELKEGVVKQTYDMCLQPTKIDYEGKPTKLIWGQTANLRPVIAELRRGEDGKPAIEVTGGSTTYQLTLQARSERIPFLFSVSGLKAEASQVSDVINTSTDLKGELVVPPLRGLGYTDSRGRGSDAGYDQSQSTYATAGKYEDATKESLAREVGEGEMLLNITSVNSQTGQIAGTFKSKQSSGVSVVPGEMEIEGTFVANFKDKQG